MLTQPERLQKLAEKHAGELALQPIEARQVVSVRDVPEKGAAPDDDVIAETIAKMAKEKGGAAAETDETDETETGSVEE